MSTHTIELTINGYPRLAKVNGSTTLLQLLRDQLRLTGSKDGCGEGDCGACTVLMDGQAVKSCLVLAAQAAGREIITIEGLTDPYGGPHPLQQAFVETGAVQCGYCIPGMLMMAKALLDANPQPTREEIRRGLSGNLCRCTGYTKIIAAVELAAARLQEGGSP